jgi:glycosyltransferase involved in cell wall biosynthesis
MIHIFINALAASAGGGLTYVRNVIPQFTLRDDARATVLLDARLRRELNDSPNIVFVEQENPPGALRRFWFEQRVVRDLIRRSGAKVLLSAGNFALWNSPVPQILLSRNSLYTSADFISDLRLRGDYRLWLDTQLKGRFAKWSIEAADYVIAPSEAFAKELQLWTGRPVTALHHGFDRDVFVHDQSPLPTQVQAKLDSGRNALRLLFVSHYNYYRNFETLIRALPLIKRKLRTREVLLFLTCSLSSYSNPGRYCADSAAALVRRLLPSGGIVELGPIPYGVLHRVYRAADVYVTPAYAESFAHPLVEALSSGLPVIASDLPVHREICEEAALYFQRFSPQELADHVVDLASSPQTATKLSLKGIERAKAFSWKLHVEHVLSVANRLASARN